MNDPKDTLTIVILRKFPEVPLQHESPFFEQVAGKFCDKPGFQELKTGVYLINQEKCYPAILDLIAVARQHQGEVLVADLADAPVIWAGKESLPFLGANEMRVKRV